MRGYVGWDLDRARAIVAFRGTEPSSLENWLSNLDAAHAVWAVGDGPTRETLRVHADSSTRTRRSATTSSPRWPAPPAGAPRRQRRATLPVAVTGHSLGGALATLAAYELQKYGFDYATVRATARRRLWARGRSGPSREGDAAFAETYGDALAEATWRITHAHDVVPSAR